MHARATASFISWPTQPGANVAAMFSMMPISSPAITAPRGLSRPPSVAAAEATTKT